MQASNLAVTLLLDRNAVIPSQDVRLKAQLSPALTPDELKKQEIKIEFSVDGKDVSAEQEDPNTAVWSSRGIEPGTRPVAIVRLRDKDWKELDFSQKHIYVIDQSISKFNIAGPDTPVPEGTSVILSADIAPDRGTDLLQSLDVRVDWDTKGFGVIVPQPPRGLSARWNTSGMKAGNYEVTARLAHKDDGELTIAGGSAIRAMDQIEVQSSPLARGDVVPVSFQRPTVARTGDQALWSAIRNRTQAISFSGSGYKDFIDRVLCERDPLPEGTPGRSALNRQIEELGSNVYGVGAYEVLKTATQVFLLLECGVTINQSGTFDNTPLFNENDEAAHLGQSVTLEEIRDRLNQYLGSGRLPYIDRVLRAAFPDEKPIYRMHCFGVLSSRVQSPCLLELIWSYWHEEGMLVQTMSAISRRFQNARGPGDRDPLAHLEIDPLRPLNNLLWGYIQDELNRLTVRRRSYEYDHHYGLTIYGKAVPTLRTADSRSKFIEGFHNLLHLTSIFYKEDNDTTVIADGFPLLNALKEVHLLLAQGAHNQFGDLPWTARAEMLIQQWLLARPEMRDFLQSRRMVPYKEGWMPQVDTMKTLQGWSDVTVTHFRDLAVYGEQILLTIRYGDWIGINDENSAKNWARYWRPEIQGYLHAYRAVTGVDLTNPDAVDYTMPAVHLQKRLATQRTR